MHSAVCRKLEHHAGWKDTAGSAASHLNRNHSLGGKEFMIVLLGVIVQVYVMGHHLHEEREAEISTEYAYYKAAHAFKSWTISQTYFQSWS
jgi:predicted MarR family transcription regulator